MVVMRITKPYLHWLGEALKKESGTLHAYCLMTNHIHLLLTTEQAESVAIYCLGPSICPMHQQNLTGQRREPKPMRYTKKAKR